MIEEDSDDSEVYKISQSSPEDKRVFDEGCFIRDSSSPFKVERETIREVSSPEQEIGSFQHSINQNLKRKRKTDHKRSLKLRKKPSLTLKITKKKTSIVFNEEVGDHANSEIILNEENSPEASKLDSSRDIFADEENITDISSPELDFSTDNNLKEKERIDTKRSLNSTKLQSLKVLKKISPHILFEEINDDDSSPSLHNEENSPEIPKSYQHNIDTSSGIPVPGTKDLKENKDSQLLSCYTPGAHKLEHNTHTCLNSTAFTITKAPKKGSLLEKALQIDSLMKNESVLFSHELNVGLRTSRGTFVSDILIVKAIHSDETYYLLECVPQFYFSELTKCEKKERVFIKTSMLVQDIKENCSIVVHFPVMTMYDTFLKCHIIFANDRVQVTSKKPPQQYFFFRELNVCVTKHTKLFHNLKSRGSKNILDGVMGRFLIHDNTLQLEILHVYRTSSRKNDAEYKKLLTIDSERQFCIIQLNLNDEVVRSLKLQMGSIYTFSGFSLTLCQDMTSKMKYLAEYYSSHCIENEYIFLMQPVNPYWNISFLKKSDSNRCSFVTTWGSIMQQELNEGRRFKLAVNAVYCNHNHEVYLKEQSTNKFIRLRVETGINDIFFPIEPFLLDGLYLHGGEVTYDAFSRIEIIQT